MRARITTLGIALVTSLALATIAAAQARTEENVNVAVSGEITAIDSAARSITIESPNDKGVVYRVADTATILFGAQPKAFGDLLRGQKVVVNGHEDGTARTLTYVKVTNAP